jgi:hypothetical protein
MGERSEQEHSSQEHSVASATGKFNQISRRPLYCIYEDGRASLSNSYALTRTLASRTMEDLGCFKSSHTSLPAQLRRQVPPWSGFGGPQWERQRAGIGPKHIICVAPIHSGAPNTAIARRLACSMSNFWLALLAAQTGANDAKPAYRSSRVLSVLGGIVLALLIGVGLFIAAVLTI